MRIFVLMLLVLVLAPTCFSQYRSRLYMSRLRQSPPQSQDCECSPLSFDGDVAAGVFKSPQFPRSYCDNLDCVYEIEPRVGEAIVITVEYFETEDVHDYVELYQMSFNSNNASSNGASAILVKHQVLTGSAVSQQHFFSALGGGLRVRFVSDESVSSYSGFQMSFYRFAGNSRRHRPCPSPTFFTASNVVQSLPQMDAHFHRNSTCVFQINSTVGEAVELRVEALYFPHLLRVYETENYYSTRRGLRSTPLLGDIRSTVHDILSTTPASQHKPYAVVKSRGDSLILVMGFLSKRTETPSPYDIQFVRTTSICSCPPANVEIPQRVGAGITYLSPGYPLEYCDDHNCTTTVSVTGSGGRPVQQQQGETTVVQVRFEAFDLEMVGDWLGMVGPSGDTLVRLSEDARALTHFTFDTAHCSLGFHTDRTVTQSGFNLTLQALAKPRECLCSGSPRSLDSAMSGRVDVAVAGKCRWMDCFWVIRLPTQEARHLSPDSRSVLPHRIVLQVQWQLAADDEWVEISYGENNRYNRQQVKLDAVMMSEPLPSDPDRATSIDSGDDNNGTRHLSFDQEDEDPFITVWYHRQGDELVDIARALHLHYEWRERCVCGQRELSAKLDEWSVLTSPDYPLDYCNNLRCDYIIRAGEGERIVVNITDFITEAHQDYLIFFNGNSTIGQHSHVLSGLPYGSRIESESNVFTLLFTTDMSIAYRGFSLLYRAEPLPPSMRRNNPSGGISSILLRLFFVGLALTLVAFTVSYLRSHTSLLNGVEEHGRRMLRNLTGVDGALNSTVARWRRRGDGEEGSLSNPLYFESQH